MATHIDGFEQFNGDRVAALLRMAGYTSGQVAMVAGRKPASRAISLYRSTLSRPWRFDGSMMSVGFAVKFSTRGPLVSLTVGGNAVYVWVDVDTGLLNIGTGFGAYTPGYINPLKDRWYYLELVLDKTAQTIQVIANGKPDITVALPSFLTGGVVVTLNPFEFSQEGDFGTRLFDDLYLNDGQRLQPIQVTTRFPTAAGAKEEWGVTGAAAGVQAVSPPINELDKFIYSAVDGMQSTFISSTGLPDDNPIRYLQLITLFRKATSDPLSLDFNIDSQVSTEANITRDWTFRYTMFGSGGYDAESIKAAEFGVKLKKG